MGKTKKDDKLIDNRTKKEIKKTAKKFSFGGILAIILCLTVGVVGGIFAEKFITKNDCFVLSGEKTYTIKLNEDFVYAEAGYKCISFGKDVSDKVAIETNMTKNEDGTYLIDTSEEGEYYIIYTIEDVKYGNIKRVRTFVVGDTNE